MSEENKKEQKSKRDTTSIKINPFLWKQVKKHCIDEDLEISEYIERLFRKDLKLKVIQNA